MRVFAQRLCCLRRTYSVLSRRLGDKCDRPQRLSTLSKRKSGTVAQFTHINAPWRPSCSARSCTVPATHRDADLECGGNQTATSNFSERIKESDYARNLFLSSSKYAASVMSPNTVHAHVTKEQALKLLEQDWTSLSNDELLSAVKRLSYNIQYSDEVINSFKYKNAIEELSSRFQKLTDDKLIVMMKHLVPFREKFQGLRFYHDLCRQLDKECLTRFMLLPINDMLLLCDTLYEINHKPAPEYIWYVIRKLGNKPRKLSPHQLVQVLFFLNVCRKPPINMYELEYYLEQCLDELSINELGVAALGFFKTGSMIRSADLLNRIMHKIINEIEYADSVSIGAIVKLIRFSMQLKEIGTLRILLDAIVPHEPRLTLMTLSHIMHACARVALYHEEFTDRVIKRLNNEIKSARLKDFERLIFALTTFNIDASSGVYHNVIEELRATLDTSRMHEISKYPHALSRMIGFMSYVNVYPKDLIKLVMSPEYIHKTCSGNYRYFSREYCVLDYSLQLEVPEYDGPFLKPEQRSFMTKKNFLESNSVDTCRANVFLGDVLQTCQEMFNSTSDITICSPLPHYVNPDIILCLDEQNQLVPSEKFLSSFSPEEIKYVDKKKTANNVKWVALVMASYGLVIRSTNLPIGLLAARIRQLSIIGYTPVVIIQTDWNEHRNSQEKHNYIRNLIYNSILSNMTNT